MKLNKKLVWAGWYISIKRLKGVTKVVYEIPFSCGQVYIGQTGRCLNERAREHKLAGRIIRVSILRSTVNDAGVNLC